LHNDKNYTSPQTQQCGRGGGRRVKVTHCRCEKEILALDPKTSPRLGYMVFFCRGGRIWSYAAAALISLLT